MKLGRWMRPFRSALRASGPLWVMAVLLAGMPGCGGSDATSTSGTNAGNESGQISGPPVHTVDSLEKVRERVANGEAVLIDVREQAEWEDGHLAVAQLVPLSSLRELPDEADSVDGLDKGKIIYCHCKSGGRVIPAAEILNRLGYDCRPLAAGFDDLVEQGFTEAGGS